MARAGGRPRARRGSVLRLHHWRTSATRSPLTIGVLHRPRLLVIRLHGRLHGAISEERAYLHDMERTGLDDSEKSKEEDQDDDDGYNDVDAGGASGKVGSDSDKDDDDGVGNGYA
jgi:hypothetical protein